MCQLEISLDAANIAKERCPTCAPRVRHIRQQDYHSRNLLVQEHFKMTNKIKTILLTVLDYFNIFCVVLRLRSRIKLSGTINKIYKIKYINKTNKIKITLNK